MTTLQATSASLRRAYTDEALDVADAYWDLAEAARHAGAHLTREGLQEAIATGLDWDDLLRVDAARDANLERAVFNYTRAEQYYLTAATEFYIDRPHSRAESTDATIARLPNPLRDEVALVYRDYRESSARSSMPEDITLARVERLAEYVSMIRDRVEAAVAPTRARETDARSR